MPKKPESPESLYNGEVPRPAKLPATANLLFDWEITRHLDGTSIKAGNRSICRITQHDPLESEAIARLLVKTPAMLRQLERMSGKMSAWARMLGREFTDDPDLRELAELLEAIQNGE